MNIASLCKIVVAVKEPSGFQHWILRPQGLFGTGFDNMVQCLTFLLIIDIKKVCIRETSNA